MTFDLLPAQHAPCASSLRCSVVDVTASPLVIRIFHGDGTLLGQKRFTDVTEASFEIAPYLRGLVDFQLPTETSSGIESAADRQLAIYLEAETPDERVQSPLLILRPADEESAKPALLTTLPRERLLAPGEWDELSFLVGSSPHPLKIVEYRRDGTIHDAVQMLPMAALWCYRVAADDYPEADTLLIDAGTLGTLRYTFLPAPEGSWRLAWQSHRGSLEHYTFPRVERVEQTIERNRAYGDKGHLVTSLEREERLILTSALEGEEWMQALAEILVAEHVWLLREGLYTEVDILTDEAEIARYGTLRSLTITLRSRLKNDLLWS